MKVVTRAMATDVWNVPMLFRFYSGSLLDLVTVDRLNDDINRHGRDDALFVLDRGFCTSRNIRHMQASERSFVIPTRADLSAVNRLLSALKGAKGKEKRVYDSHGYAVLTAEIGLGRPPWSRRTGPRPTTSPCPGMRNSVSRALLLRMSDTTRSSILTRSRPGSC